MTCGTKPTSISGLNLITMRLIYILFSTQEHNIDGTRTLFIKFYSFVDLSIKKPSIWCYVGDIYFFCMCRFMLFRSDFVSNTSYSSNGGAHGWSVRELLFWVFSGNAISQAQSEKLWYGCYACHQLHWPWLFLHINPNCLLPFPPRTKR